MFCSYHSILVQFLHNGRFSVQTFVIMGIIWQIPYSSQSLPPCSAKFIYTFITYIPQFTTIHTTTVALEQTTLCFKKKLYPFYFCNNFVDSGPIWIIFGRNVANEYYNLLTLTYLLLCLTTGNQLKCC